MSAEDQKRPSAIPTFSSLSPAPTTTNNSERGSAHNATQSITSADDQIATIPPFFPHPSLQISDLIPKSLLLAPLPKGNIPISPSPSISGSSSSINIPSSSEPHKKKRKRDAETEQRTNKFRAFMQLYFSVDPTLHKGYITRGQICALYANILDEKERYTGTNFFQNLCSSLYNWLFNSFDKAELPGVVDAIEKERSSGFVRVKKAKKIKKSGSSAAPSSPSNSKEATAGADTEPSIRDRFMALLRESPELPFLRLLSPDVIKATRTDEQSLEFIRNHPNWQYTPSDLVRWESEINDKVRPAKPPLLASDLAIKPASENPANSSSLTTPVSAAMQPIAPAPITVSVGSISSHSNIFSNIAPLLGGGGSVPPIVSSSSPVAQSSTTTSVAASDSVKNLVPSTSSASPSAQAFVSSLGASDITKHVLKPLFPLSLPSPVVSQPHQLQYEVFEDSNNVIILVPIPYHDKDQFKLIVSNTQVEINVNISLPPLVSLLSNPTPPVQPTKQTIGATAASNNTTIEAASEASEPPATVENAGHDSTAAAGKGADAGETREEKSESSIAEANQRQPQQTGDEMDLDKTTPTKSTNPITTSPQQQQQATRSTVEKTATTATTAAPAPAPAPATTPGATVTAPTTTPTSTPTTTPTRTTASTTKTTTTVQPQLKTVELMKMNRVFKGIRTGVVRQIITLPAVVQPNNVQVQHVGGCYAIILFKIR